MKKKIYKTVIRVEVLSKYPIPDDMSIETILNECNDGSYSMLTKELTKNQELTGRNAVNAILNQGTDLEFFNIDAQGNDTNEDNEEEY